MEVDDVVRLAEGLAAVAIAGLVVNPVAAAAAAGAVPVLIKVLKRHVETRNQLSQVSNEVTAWAKGENLGDDLAAGLAIATETMLRHGLIADQFKEYHYNADRGTNEVIRRARLRNPLWAATRHGFEDAGHVVARKAIRATLAGIASRHHRIESTLLVALRQEFKDAHSEWAKRAGAVEGVQGTVDDVQTDVLALAQQLIAAGTVADVMVYLRARIADWDVSVWQPDHR